MFIDISKQKPNYKIISEKFDKIQKPYILFELDNRLLYNILRGPKFAHWNNVEIGALLKMKREPDIYEQGIHHVLCYLHV